MYLQSYFLCILYLDVTCEMINLRPIYIVVRSRITWTTIAVRQIAAIATRDSESRSTCEAMESIT